MRSECSLLIITGGTVARNPSCPIKSNRFDSSGQGRLNRPYTIATTRSAYALSFTNELAGSVRAYASANAPSEASSGAFARINSKFVDFIEVQAAMSKRFRAPYARKRARHRQK